MILDKYVQKVRELLAYDKLKFWTKFFQKNTIWFKKFILSTYALVFCLY